MLNFVNPTLVGEVLIKIHEFFEDDEDAQDDAVGAPPTTDPTSQYAQTFQEHQANVEEDLSIIKEALFRIVDKIG